MSIAAVSPPRAGVPRRLGAAVRPRLEVLTAQTASTARIPFLAWCMGILLIGLATLLGLNIALSKGSYDVHAMEREQTRLIESEQQLTEQRAVASSPARVASRARSLGMIASASPVFIKLSDGSIIGEPTPASAALAPPIADIPTSLDGDAGSVPVSAVGAQQALERQRAMERDLLVDDRSAPAEIAGHGSDAAAPQQQTAPPQKLASEQKTESAPVAPARPADAANRSGTQSRLGSHLAGGAAQPGDGAYPVP